MMDGDEGVTATVVNAKDTLTETEGDVDPP
jgi:hypothetical protein